MFSPTPQTTTITTTTTTATAATTTNVFTRHPIVATSVSTLCLATSLVLGVARYDRQQQTTAHTERQLPLAYDPDAIATYWSNHTCVVLARIFDISSNVVPFLCRAGVAYASTDQWEETKQQKWGIELRVLLSNLGPTFIKFGQMLSIRPDVLPTPILVELQKLCDACQPFPTDVAIDLIEQELGKPIAAVYQGLDRHSIPIAAASLGQVFKCTLASTGQTVAVKVQRPDMVRSVSLDLYILRKYTQCVERFKALLMQMKYLGTRKQFDVHLLDTFANASYYELDYNHEASNQERFYHSLSNLSQHNHIYVPQVYRHCTSRKVLTTEWIDGVQLAKSSPETIKRLIPFGVECFLNQLLSIGFFHSDPHPGNLLVNKHGQLVLIDFGLCAEVDQLDTKGMTSAIVHLMRGDVSALIDDAIALRFLPKDVDKTSLLPALQTVFDNAQLAEENIALGGANGQGQGQGQSGRGRDTGDTRDTRDNTRGTLPVDPSPPTTGFAFEFKTQERRAQFKHISRDLNAIFYKYPFVVPDYFALITRALIVLEGIAIKGDKHFDIFAAAYPFAESRAVQVFGWTGLARIAGAHMARGKAKKMQKGGHVVEENVL